MAGRCFSLSRFFHKPQSCVSFFTRSGMTQFKDFVYGAGLLPVAGAQVRITNQALPVVRGSTATLQEEPLFCGTGDPPAAQAVLLYFMLPGCENCRPGASEFVRLARTVALDTKPPLCMRVVVSDWPTLPEIQAELEMSDSLREWGVVWDSEGVLAERLSVLGQPALYLLDGAGRVSAYRNGSVSFESPGFESFWHVLMQVAERRALLPSSQAGLLELTEERVQVKSSDHVSFLNNSLLPVVWVVSLILLCYSLTRFVLQLRKNFRSSQNKS